MMVRFAQISDTHIGPDPDFTLYGVNTLSRFERLVDRLNEHASSLDFIVHTGDLVAAPDPASFQLAARCLSRLQKPVYLVVGNHDSSAGLRAICNAPGKIPLEDDERAYGYAFELRDQQFVVLDGRGPDTIDPHGFLGDRQLDALERRLAATRGCVTLFLHFPAYPLDSPWFDTHMRLLDEEAFRAVLKRYADRIRGVFSGHVHRGMQVVRDGIFYCSVASSFCQFQAWPDQETVHFDPSPLAYYHLVTIDDYQIQVRQLDVGEEAGERAHRPA